MTVPPTDDDLSGSDIEPVSTTGRWWSRIDRSVVVATLVVALGIALVVQGVLVGVTGSDRVNLPDQIESIDPGPGSIQSLSGTRVFVDLATGYTGRLVIDSIELETVNIGDLGGSDFDPGLQVSLPPATVYEPGNATLTFTPTEGSPIEQFEQGLHRATVIYWAIEDGPTRARSFSWTFNTV